MNKIASPTLNQPEQILSGEAGRDNLFSLKIFLVLKIYFYKKLQFLYLQKIFIENILLTAKIGWSGHLREVIADSLI